MLRALHAVLTVALFVLVVAARKALAVRAATGLIDLGVWLLPDLADHRALQVVTINRTVDTEIEGEVRNTLLDMFAGYARQNGKHHPPPV